MAPCKKREKRSELAKLTTSSISGSARKQAKQSSRSGNKSLSFPRLIEAPSALTKAGAYKKNTTATKNVLCLIPEFGNRDAIANNNNASTEPRAEKSCKRTNILSPLVMVTGRPSAHRVWSVTNNFQISTNRKSIISNFLVPYESPNKVSLITESKNEEAQIKEIKLYCVEEQTALAIAPTSRKICFSRLAQIHERQCPHCTCGMRKEVSENVGVSPKSNIQNQMTAHIVQRSRIPEKPAALLHLNEKPHITKNYSEDQRRECEAISSDSDSQKAKGVLILKHMIPLLLAACFCYAVIF